MITTHYESGLSQNPRRLMTYARNRAKNINRMFGVGGKYEHLVPLFAYSGMSGVAFATALIVALEDYNIKYGLVYVRKKNERSHGGSVEYSIPTISKKKVFLLTILDDFIGTGDTANYIAKRCVTYIPVEFQLETEGSGLACLHTEVTYLAYNSSTVKLFTNMMRD